MCNSCKDNVKPETKELTMESIEMPKLESSPLSSDSTSDLIMFFEPLELGTDNLAEDDRIQLDNDEFVRGLKDASYACGMYTALINVGFSMEDAVAYIFNRMNVDHNIEVSKINANATVESSKNVAVVREKELL